MIPVELNIDSAGKQNTRFGTRFGWLLRLPAAFMECQSKVAFSVAVPRLLPAGRAEVSVRGLFLPNIFENNRFFKYLGYEPRMVAVAQTD